MEAFNTPNQQQTMGLVDSCPAVRHGYVVNLSNHPSSKWADAQKEAALRLLKDQRPVDEVEIVDVPFPQLDPNDQGFEWGRTIGMWLETLLAKAGKALVGEDHDPFQATGARIFEDDFSDVADIESCDPLIPGIHGNVMFHIMGESVWVFNAVSYLVKEGFACMASTTERKVVTVINPDGTTTKTSTFDFVGFRVY